VAGATGAAVDGAARSVIEAAGYGGAFVHRTGHGLGLEVHEPPSLHAANDEPLPENAVVTVEPGIYLSGYGGIRIEDDVVVRPGKPEVLTHHPIGAA
jgi:Xaa-Pro dipeptidase